MLKLIDVNLVECLNLIKWRQLELLIVSITIFSLEIVHFERFQVNFLDFLLNLIGKSIFPSYHTIVSIHFLNIFSISVLSDNDRVKVHAEILILLVYTKQLVASLSWRSSIYVNYFIFRKHIIITHTKVVIYSHCRRQWVIRLRINFTIYISKSTGL